MKNVLKRQLFRSWARLALVLLVILYGLRASCAIFDNFSSGNDNAWSHLEPLAGFGSPGIYSFPGGGYRIQATASTNATSLGVGRSGSLRLDLNLSGNFLADADVVAWDNNLGQSFGLFGRVTTPGLGTTKGYVFTYSTVGVLAISSINNESLSVLESQLFQTDPAKSYQFTFRGQGPDLAGQLCELLPGGGCLPVAVLLATDNKYTSGVTGLDVFSNVGSGTADATFDNFRATTFIVPEPSSWALMTIGGLTLFLSVFRARKSRRNEGKQTTISCRERIPSYEPL